MAPLPTDVLSLIGFGAIGATILVLVFSSWPKAYVLAMSSILVFGLQTAACFNGAPGCLGLFRLALSSNALAAGAVWTVVTYAFLHGGLFHLFGNIFILVTAGPALEESIGGRWFLTVYTAGALAAGLAGVLLARTTELVEPFSLMVGASGAIFAVLTTYAVRHPHEKLPMLLIFVVWLPSMTVLLIFLALNIAYIFLDTRVAWYGHFAGFLVGLALASLPIGKTTVRSQLPLDLDAFAPLASTPRAHEAVEHLAPLMPGEEAVAEAWLDVLADESSCPACGERLGRTKLRLVCPNGHDVQALPKRVKRAERDRRIKGG